MCFPPELLSRYLDRVLANEREQNSSLKRVRRIEQDIGRLMNLEILRLESHEVGGYCVDRPVLSRVAQ